MVNLPRTSRNIPRAEPEVYDPDEAAFQRLRRELRITFWIAAGLLVVNFVVFYIIDRVSQ